MRDDKPTYQERLKGILHTERPAPPSPKKDGDPEEAEASCAAFGYLRGIGDRANWVEFRLRDGIRRWFAYGLLGTFQYDPSEGLLLKFSGDPVSLVLIRGSNLDLPLNDGHMNLTSGGLQRRRVVWIREMAEEDIKSVGETGPTIDSIQIAEFESNSDLKEWLSKNAPAFIG